MSDYDKESYIMRDFLPDAWIAHPNSQITDRHSDIIRGDCLDIGCNHGASSTHRLLSNDKVTSITGVDINCDSIEFAKKLFKDVKIPNDFYCLNIVEDALLQKFDTIITYHTLEHIYSVDLPSFLSNIRKMLKDEGHLIIVVPYDRCFDGPEHVAWYDAETLKLLLLINGFSVINCYDAKDLQSVVGIFT